MEIYRSGGYSLIFPKDLQDVLSEAQKEFAPEDPKVGIIQEWLDGCEHDSVCSLMIYREALGNTLQEPKSWELREISSIMNKSITGWEKHQTKDSQVRFKAYGKQRAWDRVDSNGYRQRVHIDSSTDGFTQIDICDMESDFPFK